MLSTTPDPIALALVSSITVAAASATVAGSMCSGLWIEAPLLAAEETVGDAVRKVLDSGLPALPVVDGSRLVGIFGEREFITALFPAYLKELNYAAFVPQSLDMALGKRHMCRLEPVSQHMNTSTSASIRTTPTRTSRRRSCATAS